MKVITVYFKVLSQHLPAGTEENDKNLHQDSWPLGWESTSGPSKYKRGVSTTMPWHSGHSEA